VKQRALDSILHERWVKSTPQCLQHIKVSYVKALYVQFNILLWYFKMSAFVPTRVIWTTGECVIWSNGPNYTEHYEWLSFSRWQQGNRKVSIENGRRRTYSELWQRWKAGSVLMKQLEHNVPKTTLKRYNTGKAITCVVPIGHPVDLPDVAEDLVRHLLHLEKIFYGHDLSFRFKLNIRS
jgi:hypothetical protein